MIAEFQLDQLAADTTSKRVLAALASAKPISRLLLRIGNAARRNWPPQASVQTLRFQFASTTAKHPLCLRISSDVILQARATMRRGRGSPVFPPPPQDKLSCS